MPLISKKILKQYGRSVVEESRSVPYVQIFAKLFQKIPAQYGFLNLYSATHVNGADDSVSTEEKLESRGNLLTSVKKHQPAIQSKQYWNYMVKACK